MTEERKNKIEEMAKEIFMTGIDDLLSDNAGAQVVVEFSAGCTVFAKKFYEGFDKVIDK